MVEFLILQVSVAAAFTFAWLGHTTAAAYCIVLPAMAVGATQGLLKARRQSHRKAEGRLHQDWFDSDGSLRVCSDPKNHARPQDGAP